jgi:ATP synthase F1 gamma subunit
MPRIEGLKNEMKTMKDLEDITNMLEQVAARDIAQMREQILQSRPFFQQFWVIHRVLKELTPPPPEVVHKHLIVAIGIDWGMPGDLQNKVMDEAERQYAEHGADMLIAGKMAHFRFRGRIERTIHFFDAPKKSSLADISPIYKTVAKYAHITFVYPQFESLSKQTVKIASMSNGSGPSEDIEIKSKDTKAIESKRFIIEPDPQSLANYMNETIVGLSLYHYFAESMLAYSAAQMVAMRNSYENAKDESKRLRNRYHRARREIIDTKLRELYGSRVKVNL